MPVYLCNTAKGAISDSAKTKIADDITSIHCAVTGAPEIFVNVFFLEEAPNQPLNGKSAFVIGSIRSGRTATQKSQIIDEVTRSIQTHAGLPIDAIAAVTVDTPASWVMEGGEIYPEPGEEAAWLAAQEAKHATQQAR